MAWAPAFQSAGVLFRINDFQRSRPATYLHPADLSRGADLALHGLIGGTIEPRHGRPREPNQACPVAFERLGARYPTRSFANRSAIHILSNV